jgi:hypothetical protein
MQDCYGQRGWKEFHQNRQSILSEFDKIAQQISSKPVKVAHGVGVEAYLRKWLSDFLPKKFGVTSGYIIPTLYDDKGALYHFDIIIYNCLEAPVLWTEGNADNSEQGKYRAIPARHVVAVYEVKSSLTKKNVKDALEKLGQTESFKDQLHRNYSCGVIFVDLKEDENNNEKIIKELHNGYKIHGFSGGMVLRYEGDDTSTGVISVFPDNAETEKKTCTKPLAKRIDDLNIYLTEDGNLRLAENGGGAVFVATSMGTWAVSKSYGVNWVGNGYRVYLNWSRSNFSRFCVDFLGTLDGVLYNDENKSSFGMIFDSIRTKKAPLQASGCKPGYPFITVSLFGGGANGEMVLVSREGDDWSIEFWVKVTNEGDAEAIVSDDLFKNSITVPPGKSALRDLRIMAKAKKKGVDFIKLLNEDSFEFSYRVVYKVPGHENELFSVERVVRIIGNNIEFV